MRARRGAHIGGPPVRGDRELVPRFSGCPWEPHGPSTAQSLVGLLIMAGLAVGLALAWRTAQDGRLWLLLGACLSGAAAAYLLVGLLFGRPAPARGWRSRGPWPSGPGLVEHRTSLQQLVGGTLAFAVLGMGLGSQAVVQIARGSWDGVLPLALFGALALVGAGFAGYVLLQALRYRPARLDPTAGDWPLTTGTQCQLEVAGPAIALDDGAGLSARLMLLQEYRAIHATRRGMRTVVQIDRLAEMPVDISLRALPSQGLDARLSFHLPSGPVIAQAQRLTGSRSAGVRAAFRRADGSYAEAARDTPPQPVAADTDLSADEPRYWLLVMRADVAGIDWYAEWILPVEAPGQG